MIAYSVAIGNLPLRPQVFWKKETKQAIELIKTMKGLIGVYPSYPKGSLLLFRTRNDAVEAKNILDYEGVLTGSNICEVEIDDRYKETNG